MRRGGNLRFLILNIVVSLLVVGAAITIINSNQPEQEARIIPVTVPILVTTTPDPLYTPPIIIITATPQPGTVILPSGLIEVTDATGSLVTLVPVATLDPLVLAADPGLQATTTALPTNCIPYTLQDGDTPFGIAFEYGADLQAMLAVNGLTEETAAFLQIGQVLIVPLEGCDLSAQAIAQTQTATLLPSNTPTTAPTLTPTGTLPSPTFTPSLTFTPSPLPSVTPTLTFTPTRTITPTFTLTPSQTPSVTATPSVTLTPTLTPSITPTATITLPPTAENAQLVIQSVSGIGDVTVETIDLFNPGQTVNLVGWRVVDGQGNTYTFAAERNLFSNGRLSIRTGRGSDTPAVIFWNRDEAVLSSGDTLTLFDDDGRAQSTFRVP